ncbi:MAG: L,D-transpeptidase YcbB, partial [Sphingomonadales bacterium]|nr:L,D-transpeptidase YcbB [Sphingomonadales bacterium]
MHRRAFLLSGTFAFAATAMPAWAQQAAEIGSQAEWSQNYDAASRIRVRRSPTPALSAQAAAATEQAIEHYRDIVARGGWAPLQIGQNTRVGARGPGVVALRQRLIMTGDLDPAAGSLPNYDSYVEAGVRRFQARHGLTMSGAVNAATLAALNVPAQTRLRQLEINLVRLRAYSGNLGHRYVVVNIPAALVETVEDG